MLKYQEHLDRMFHALADGTRRAMVEHLACTPASVSELARPFEMSMPAIVQHLKVLEDAGIVTSEKIGRVRTVQLAPGAMGTGREWIDKQRLPAERQLDRLGAVLASADITPGEPT